MKQKILILFTFSLIGWMNAKTQCGFNNYVEIGDFQHVANGAYNITYDLYINTDAEFTDAEILIAPQVKIIITEGATLKIIGSHLYGCTEMWGGIDVQNGKLFIDRGITHDNSLIEDADIAVKKGVFTDFSTVTNPPTELYINNTIFNRNRIGIKLWGDANVTASTSGFINYFPVVIKNSIFTCREIAFTVGNNDWVKFNNLKNTPISNAVSFAQTPETMSSPYIDDGTYYANDFSLRPNAYLKAPLNSTPTKSEIGIYFGLDNYSIAASPTSYGTFRVGDENGTSAANNVTIFDNQTKGIYMLQTNVRINNCTFQNTPDANPNVETYGIFAENRDEAHNHLTTTASYGKPHNAFFDCKHAITSNFYTHISIEDCDIRSSKTAPLGSVQEGFEGVTVRTNGFGCDDFNNNDLRVQRNEIANIANGISVIYDDFPWVYYANQIYTPSPLKHTPYLANIIEVNDNWISVVPQFLGGNITISSDYFVDQAINITSIYNYNKFAPSGGVPTFNPAIHCHNNLLQLVTNGILVSNLEGKDVRTINNIIQLMGDGSMSQFGIKFSGIIPENSIGNFIYNNNIIGHDEFGLKDGVFIDNGNNFIVRCNTSSSLNPFYHFRGNLPILLFVLNKLDPQVGQYNNWGLLLDNAIIGQQGNALLASNNEFQRATSNYWTSQSSGLSKTHCINSSLLPSSTSPGSVLYVQQGNPIFDPSDVGGFTFNSAFGGSTPIPYRFTNGSLQAGVSDPAYDCRQPIAERTQLVDIGAKQYHIVPNAPQLHLPIDESQIPINNQELMNQKTAEMVQLAQGNALQTLCNEPALRQYVAQMGLYQFLLSNNGVAANNSILQEFVNTNNSGSFGIINNINNEIFAGSLTTAQQLLNNWTKINSVDVNYALYLGWLIDRKQGNTLNLSNIENLATKCPQTDGNVVFAAQNLYNAITNEHRLFTTSCDLPPIARSRGIAPAGNITKSSSDVVVVYPNPATNNVNIKGNNIKHVTLLNTIGETLVSKNVLFGTVNLSLDKLSSGIYFVKITGADNTVSVKKLVKN